MTAFFEDFQSLDRSSLSTTFSKGADILFPLDERLKILTEYYGRERVRVKHKTVRLLLVHLATENDTVQRAFLLLCCLLRSVLLFVV